MWKFDFGPGEPAAGYKGVSPDCFYSAELGYGFETAEHVYGRERPSPVKDAFARLRSSFCIPLNAAFIADVPDGMYLVTMLLGDPLAETFTRLKAGEGKHMLPPVHTLPVRGGPVHGARSGRSAAPRRIGHCAAAECAGN